VALRDLGHRLQRPGLAAGRVGPAPRADHATRVRLGSVDRRLNLVGVEGDRFPRWHGDLLVSSLGMQTLFRVRLDGDRVAYVEPIRIGRRLRDVVEAPDGAIWLWTDEGDLLTLDLVDEDERGVAAFASCVPCHPLDSDRIAGGLGPNLFGVVGRQVASTTSYPAYSEALRRVGGRWTEARLDAFLADPQAFAPGTTMTEAVGSAEDRAALVAFLRARR
jgi:cytochrome c2